MSIELFKNDKLQVVRAVSFLVFLIPMLLTKSLWFSTRNFPTIPLFDTFSITNIYFDVFLLVTFLSFFVWFIINPNWKIGLPVVIIYTLWALLDQNRIQNFFFEIIYVVLALTIFSNNIKLAKECLLLIFVGTYFYSGLHKYNDLFFEKWMGGLDKRIPFIPYWMRSLFTNAIPFIEAAFGLGLLFIKTRKIVIWLLACMHGIIIVTLLKDSFGFAVIPLNIFNVFVLYYLFYEDSEINFKSIFKINHVKKVVFLLITIIFPCFNFLGKYDHILAFSYLSGKPKYARVYIDKRDLKSFPIGIQSSIREFNGMYYIDFNEWAGKTIKVLVYPEERVYKDVKAYLDQYAKIPTEIEYY
ncbi:hypothetical protein [Pseudofulvibacter geojedonensis]|uniref:HTTM domain-containing protein n=1 Tax=Pseudofulvibacter geojedonensis TaxID=1123758 RepID=A0ABW3I2Q3_9FLAO